MTKWWHMAYSKWPTVKTSRNQNKENIWYMYTHNEMGLFYNIIILLHVFKFVTSVSGEVLLNTNIIVNESISIAENGTTVWY